MKSDSTDGADVWTELTRIEIAYWEDRWFGLRQKRVVRVFWEPLEAIDYVRQLQAEGKIR